MSVVHKSEDGNVVLLVRDDSPNYFCRFHHPGLKRHEPVRWIQRSTGSHDLEEVIDIAVEMLRDALYQACFARRAWRTPAHERKDSSEIPSSNSASLTSIFQGLQR